MVYTYYFVDERQRLDIHFPCVSLCFFGICTMDINVYALIPCIQVKKRVSHIDQVQRLEKFIVCYKWCCKWTFELTNYSASIWEKMSKNKKCGAAGFIKNALHKNLYNLKIIVFTNCKNTVIFEEFVTSECKCNSFFTLCSYHRSNF